MVLNDVMDILILVPLVAPLFGVPRRLRRLAGRPNELCTWVPWLCRR